MTKKVYELANELGLGALDLVEALKKDGITVRNHMSELSDSDLSKFMEKREAEMAQKAQATKKVVKKTTVKKKVETPVAADSTTKSKAAKSAAPKAKIADLGDEDKKSTSVRKKLVVRKKNDEQTETHLTEQSVEHDEQIEQVEQIEPQFEEETQEEQLVSGPVETVRTERQEKAPASAGLRVVSRPEVIVKKAVVEEKRTEAPTAQVAQKKEIYREKVHRFTPVFIPEKKEEIVVEKKKPFTTTTATTKPVDEEIETEETKKRVGGLAAMMSGKHKVAKSREIVELRAEEELKSYALNILGRPIYTTVGKKKSYVGPASKTILTETKESKRVVELHKGGTLKEIAGKLSIKFSELANKLLELNLLVRESDYVGIKLASKMAEIYGFRVVDISFKEDKIIQKDNLSEDDKVKLPLRNPIVTIMGHVDHGKTTLLDTIRKAKVAAGEAGGITQHIGAYSVKVKDREITFLDTPGHAAFASMRQRGADVTDIVILVVAADDGVMPQTKESIRFCKEAGVPIIVAVNKMDKEGVNPDRIKQALTEFELLPEDWGGQTMYVPISALKGDGIDNLLESIMVQAEIMELRADPKGAVEGVVIESKIELGRGPVATILITSGTLEKGETIVVGETYGRARSLMDHLGNQLKNAGPSTPVQILGLNEAPSPGDAVNVVKSEREAKKIVDNRVAERKDLERTPEKKKSSLEDFFAAAESAEGKKVLKLIVRTDVQGSFEAIKNAITAIGNDEVSVEVIGGGIGAITDNDVLMASSSNGYIIGFNMRPVTTARRLAEQHGVDIKTYSIIYELINDVKLALEGLLAPTISEKFIGRAEVRNVFNIPKIGVIAGTSVIDGKIMRGCNIRLLRDGKIVFDGKLSSLKRFKDDVKEVNHGYECGMSLENYNDIKVLDIFEAYIMEEQKRTLELPAN